MAEYIDKQGIIDFLKVQMDTYFPEFCDYATGIKDSMYHIRQYPLSDVAPVKHGKWIGYQTNSFKNSSEGLKRKFYRCSICRTANAIRVNYCPYCGADMRGNRDE